jgi:hypothetical protein
VFLFSQSFVCLIYSVNFCSPTNFDSNFFVQNVFLKFLFPNFYSNFSFSNFDVWNLFWTKILIQTFAFSLFLLYKFVYNLQYINLLYLYSFIKWINRRNIISGIRVGTR